MSLETKQSVGNLQLASGAKVGVDEKTIAVEDLELPHTFPDGGFWAWSTAIGAFLIQFSTFGYINAFGVYQDFYVREYLTASSPSTIGWIGGVQIFLNFGLGVATGRLFDRGYFRHLLLSTILLVAIALYMLSLSHENQYYQVFLTNGVGLGAACGIIYVPSLAIVSHYFQRRRALVLGFVSSGSALGAILHPIMLNHLFNSGIGFHNGVRISATLDVVLLMIAFALMRTRLPPKEVQNFPIMKWIFKEHAYGLALFSSILTFLGLFFPIFYLQLYAIKHGVGKSNAFYAISVVNTASVVGRTVPNGVAHKFGLANSLVFFLFATGTVTLAMTAVKDVASTYIFSVVYGFCSGAFIALVPATIGSMAKDMNEVGARLGLFFGFGSVFGLFATPIAGALLTEQYHWLHAILFSGISMLLSGLVFIFIRNMLAKQKGHYIV